VAHFNIPELNLEGLKGSLNDPNQETLIAENFPAYKKGESNGPLVIKLGMIYDRMIRNPETGEHMDAHSGYITKGDNNGINAIDQYSTSSPVEVDWVIGIAKGELPWFGLIKLWIGGLPEGETAPPTSVNMLILTVALLLILPLVIDISYTIYIKKKKKKEEESERSKEPEEEKKPKEKGPGRLGMLGLKSKKEEEDDMPPPERPGDRRRR
jgi:hypothetical protein